MGRILKNRLSALRVNIHTVNIHNINYADIIEIKGFQSVTYDLVEIGGNRHNDML